MKIRFPREGEEGPFLAGVVQCRHITCQGVIGNVAHDPLSCPLCHGQEWLPTPVVIEGQGDPDV